MRPRLSGRRNDNRAPIQRGYSRPAASSRRNIAAPLSPERLEEVLFKGLCGGVGMRHPWRVMRQAGYAFASGDLMGAWHGSASPRLVMAEPADGAALLVGAEHTLAKAPLVQALWDDRGRILPPCGQQTGQAGGVTGPTAA